MRTTVATFTVVSGETQEPIVGALVVLPGLEQTSDVRGNVTVTGGTAAPMEVTADGYIDRVTTLSRVEGGRLSLWPLESPTGLTQHFTAEVVYTSSAVGATDPVFAAESMRRWTLGISRVEVVYLGTDDNPEYVQFDEHMLGLQRRAIEIVNTALAGRVVYSDPEEGRDLNGYGRVRLRLYPGLSFCGGEANTVALATLHEAPSVRNVTITFCSASAASNLGTIVHELGHSLGLRHSSERSDIMYRSTSRRTDSPSSRERLTMALMLQRSPGNRFPDNDREVGLTSSSEDPVDIVCQ